MNVIKRDEAYACELCEFGMSLLDSLLPEPASGAYALAALPDPPTSTEETP